MAKIVVTLIALVAVVIGITAPLASAKLERVFVLHRHGARTAMGVVDGNLDCNLPYCALSDQGKAQCTALGQALAHRYAALLNLPNYTVTKIQSVSTSVPRVIKSAEAMITGMYPDALPFVDFIPRTQDIQMSPWMSWPSYQLTNGDYLHQAEATKAILQIVNQSTLAALGDFYGTPGTLCSSSNTVTRCAGVVSDTYFCHLMSGKKPAQDLVSHEAMQRIRAATLSYINGYFPETSKQNAATGSYGYPLASAMIHMLTYVPQTGFEYTLIHRAAHDWTLVALYSALGVWTPAKATDPFFAINFAEALIVERHSHTDGPDTLVAYRAVPGQMHSSDYQFPVDIRPLGLRCQSGSGSSTYTNETKNGCTIDDVQRAINTTAPKADGAGDCYATQQQLAANDCAGHSAPAPGSVCYFYRSNCPTVPCGGSSEQIADASRGYACAAMHAPSRSALSLTKFGLTGGFCAVAGLVVGAVAMFFNRHRFQSLAEVQ